MCVFVCTCHGYHSVRLWLQVLDGFIIIAFEPLMTAADRRRSPDSRSQTLLVEKRRAGGKKEAHELKLKNEMQEPLPVC